MHNMMASKGTTRACSVAALHVTIAAASLLALSSPVPTLAQAYDPNNASVPYGSPVPNQGQTRQENSSRDSSRDSTTRQNETSDRIEPVEVSDPTVPAERVAAEENDGAAASAARVRPIQPSEFETYVERTLGKRLNRFGSELLLPGNGDYAVPATATVPPDYTLNVGDTISIAMTGSIEGSVDRRIDTDGRIFLERVGPIQLAGVKYRDVRDRVSAAIGRQYRGYTVSVSVQQLRGIRVYVTGFANNPGAYSVNSLSTMVNAVLAAGGPSSGGSFRSAKLYRNGRLAGDLDLYDLILKGNRSGDEVLQNEDVIFITPLGSQVAVTGSINAEAVYEMKPGETLATLLGYAGGANVLADKDRFVINRLSDVDTLRGREVAVANIATTLIEGGDIVQVLAKGTIVQPTKRQAVIIRLEGEVERPGNYYVAPGTALSQVIAQAGGLTERAFVFGTRLERLSVRTQQRESYREAVDQLETSVLSSPLVNSRVGADDRDAQLLAAKSVLERLRVAEPDGRVVLNLTANSTTLPGDLVLENNDNIIVPPRPSTIGVFGAVYRPASFLIDRAAPLRVRDYLQKAGGPLRLADIRDLFVVRANGEVLTRRKGALASRVLPGDVVFVPVKTQSTSLLAKLRDISSVLFQFGLGAAAFVAVTR